MLYEWGYNEKLLLDEATYLCPSSICLGFKNEFEDFEIAALAFQFSNEAISFFENLFNRFANGRTFPVSQLPFLFSRLSENSGLNVQVACPWVPETVSGIVALSDAGEMTLNFAGFVSLWYSLLDNSERSIRQLSSCAAFLGFEHSEENNLILWKHDSHNDATFERSFFHVLIVSNSRNIGEKIMSVLARIPNAGSSFCVTQIDDEKTGPIFVRFEFLEFSSASRLDCEFVKRFDLIICGFDNEESSIDAADNFCSQVKAHTKKGEDDIQLAEAIPIIFASTAGKHNLISEVKCLKVRNSFGLKEPLWPFDSTDFKIEMGQILKSNSKVDSKSNSKFKIQRGTAWWKVGVVVGGLIAAGVAGYFVYNKYLKSQESNQ